MLIEYRDESPSLIRILFFIRFCLIAVLIICEIESQNKYFKGIWIHFRLLYLYSRVFASTLSASCASREKSDLQIDSALHRGTRCTVEVSRTIPRENSAIRYHPKTAIASRATEDSSQSCRHDTDKSSGNRSRVFATTSNANRVRCRGDLMDFRVDRRLLAETRGAHARISKRGTHVHAD